MPPYPATKGIRNHFQPINTKHDGQVPDSGFDIGVIVVKWRERDRLDIHVLTAAETRLWQARSTATGAAGSHSTAPSKVVVGFFGGVD